eukprot:scaffold148145_cov18-Tisochrysis_lutea.AAC.1
MGFLPGSAGDDNFWNIAESSLVEALNKKGWSYQVRSLQKVELAGSFRMFALTTNVEMGHGKM